MSALRRIEPRAEGRGRDEGDLARTSLKKDRSIGRRHSDRCASIHDYRGDNQLLEKAVADDHADFLVGHALLAEELARTTAR